MNHLLKEHVLTIRPHCPFCISVGLTASLCKSNMRYQVLGPIAPRPIRMQSVPALRLDDKHKTEYLCSTVDICHILLNEAKINLSPGDEELQSCINNVYRSLSNEARSYLGVSLNHFIYNRHQDLCKDMWVSEFDKAAYFATIQEYDSSFESKPSTLLKDHLMNLTSKLNLIDDISQITIEQLTSFGHIYKLSLGDTKIGLSEQDIHILSFYVKNITALCDFKIHSIEQNWWQKLA